MHQIGEPQTVIADNAFGRPCRVIHTTYEIEHEDVGTVRENYLGHGRPGQTFRLNDVSREIIVYTDGTGWTCWSWRS